MASAETRWMFSPRDTNPGFEGWPALEELFPVAYQGVNPNRGLDGSVVDADRTTLARRMQDYFTAASAAAVREAHPVLMTPRAGYSPDVLWNELHRHSAYSDERLVPYLVFPLDVRWVYYETEGNLLNRRRPEFWDNLSANEFLVTVPQPRRASEQRPLLAATLLDLHVHDRGSVCFPRESGSGTLLKARSANLPLRTWEKLKTAWGLAGDLKDDAAKALVGALFRCALGMLHAPSYETDHKDALAQDWAHLPIPKDRHLFDALAGLGDKVAMLLDPQADADSVVEEILGPEVARSLGAVRKSGGASVAESDLAVTISYFGAAKGRWVERAFATDEPGLPAFGARTGDLYINDEVCFGNVPEAVWQYELGGYPVLKKWLGYRRSDGANGRPLGLAAARHFRSMVQRLAALVVLRDQLDAGYEQASANAFTAEELGLRA